jgi:hypothetical protein
MLYAEQEKKLKEAEKLEQKKIREFATAKLKLMEDKSFEDEDERDEMQNVLNYRIKESGIHPNKIGNYMMQHHDELMQKLKS